MEITTFKQQVLDGTVSDDFLVIECPENFFLADQYVDMICTKRCLPREPIKSLAEIRLGSSLALVFDFSNQISVLKVDTFAEVCEDYSEFKNVIVLCKKVDKHIASFVAPFSVKMPKLVDWQIEAYVKQLCPALDDTAIKWLCSAVNNDIYKIQSEVDKLTLFSAEEQRDLLIRFKDTDETDLFSMPHYVLCDAIIRKDLPVIKEYLNHQKSCKFELFKMLGNLVCSLRDVVLLTGNVGKNRNKNSLGIYPARVWEVTGSDKAPTYREMNPEINPSTRARLEFLSEVDLKVKSGEWDLSEQTLIDYIIIKMIA